MVDLVDLAWDDEDELWAKEGVFLSDDTYSSSPLHPSCPSDNRVSLASRGGNKSDEDHVKSTRSRGENAMVPLVPWKGEFLISALLPMIFMWISLSKNHVHAVETRV